jgi:hypothetical protein
MGDYRKTCSERTWQNGTLENRRAAFPVQKDAQTQNIPFGTAIRRGRDAVPRWVVIVFIY